MPQFPPLSQFWPAYEPGETYDIYETRCSHIWCHATQCLIDPYFSSLQTQVKDIEQRIKPVLEDYKYGNLGQGEDFQRFKRRMEEHDLVRLLPGVVPGFALRHRKWGESATGTPVLGALRSPMNLMLTHCQCNLILTSSRNWSKRTTGIALSCPRGIERWSKLWSKPTRGAHKTLRAQRLPNMGMFPWISLKAKVLARECRSFSPGLLLTRLGNRQGMHYSSPWSSRRGKDLDCW